jgi:hypothetical protein
MKKIVYSTTLFGVCALLMTSCNLNSQKIIELQNEVRFLETEVSSLKASPGFSFGEAFEYVDAEDYKEALTILKTLQNDFPEWNKELVEKFIEEYSKEEIE